MINSRETETISINNRLKENEENIRLIWFDDKTSIYSEIESKLLRLNPIGKFFQDFEELFSFIKLIINEKIFLIISSENHLKANTIRNIGLIYKDYQQWNQALDYFNKTLQMRIRILSNNNHPDIAICYGDIASIYENLNQNELAFDYYNRQLDIEEKFYSFDHPILILHFD